MGQCEICGQETGCSYELCLKCYNDQKSIPEYDEPLEVTRKKDTPVRIKEKSPKESGESAIELLKKRLVKEEITAEQYRELRDLLLEK